MPKSNCAVILTALPIEYLAVSAHLHDLKEIVHLRGTVYESGVFTANERDWEVNIAEIGAGNSGAAAEAERAIAFFDPSVVFFVGVAGGVKDVKVGDVVAATKVYGYESGKSKDEFEPRPNVGESSYALEQRAHAEARREDWLRQLGNDAPTAKPKVFVGPIAAGEKVVAATQSAVYQFICAQYGDALAVEMEGRGFLQATHANQQIQAIVIRGISDLIDKKSEADAVGSQELASRHASAFAFEILAKLNPIFSNIVPDVQQPVTTISEPTSDIEPQIPIFEIPFEHNRNFSGREDILAALHPDLSVRPNEVVTQAITGLGGVGKTQIAIEYAHRYADDYDLVWWIRAEEAATLTADFMALANRLQLPVKAGAEQIVFVNIVRHWLEKTTRKWLLIFDTATDQDWLNEILPVKGNGHILITSQNPNWRRLANVLPIAPFTSAEAKEFFINRIDESDLVAVDRLAGLLGRLPLALEVAAAYICEHGLSADGYIRLYEEQRQELWQRETPPPGYRATVTTVWELAFQQIKKSTPATALLNLVIFLAPNDIPLSLLRDGSAYLPRELSVAATNSIDLEDAVAILYRYSLLERKGDTVSIHRLVQDVARERVGSKRAPRWATAAMELMQRAFSFDKYDMHTWTISARLLSHAFAAVEYAEKYQMALVQAAAIWQKAGEYLRQQGEYIKAQAAIEHALKLRRQEFGEEHEAVAESLAYLGELHQEQGAFIQARAFHERALKLRLTKLGPEHSGTAASLNNLGVLFEATGEYSQAKACLDEALTIRKQVLGEKHPDTATSLSNLGSLFQAQGEYAQAKVCLDEALIIRKQVLGERHPDTSSSLNNLGSLSRDQGEYAQAEVYYEEALAICKQVLGEKHPHTAIGHANLGLLFRDQGEYARAKVYCEEALAIFKQVLREKHPSTATGLNNLGLLLQDQGEYTLAKVYYREALSIFKLVLGEKHPDTATSLSNLGSLFQAQGEYAQAKVCLDEALIIRKQVLGERHPDTASSLNNLGSLSRDQGEYAQAEVYYEEALAICKQVLGEKHPHTAASLHNMGELFSSQGKYVAARPYLEQALSISEKTLGDKHPNLVTVLSNLGTTMFHLKQFTLARSYLSRAAHICKSTTEQYDECEKVKQLIKSMPGGQIGHGKKQSKHRK